MRFGDREPFIPSARASFEAEVVRLLLERGADPNAQDSFQGTLLMRAAWNGHLEAVRALLEGGAEVDARFFSMAADRTALMVAAQRGHLEIVELLLSKGADVKAKAANGWTASRYARENGQDQIVKVLKAAGARWTCRMEHAPSDRSGMADGRKRKAKPVTRIALAGRATEKGAWPWSWSNGGQRMRSDWLSKSESVLRLL